MRELLVLATAGSVDDGKSTLIGRLLYDSKSLYEDQLEAVSRDSERRGEDVVNLALLTDGLRAEREQGITIDVAYRYFSTPRRSFAIADTPGHVEYTRNMVTGASGAQVAVILVDARKGLLEQSRRHAFLASLLGISHLVVCVNKMDLVGWSQDRFESIREEFGQFARRLRVHDLAFIPISALHGDNVVEGSMEMPWYTGTPLLHHLEEVYVGADENLTDPRLPVQYVIRPGEHGESRRYAGTLASGVLRNGDEVVVLPSGTRSTVTSIDSPDGPVEEAFSPMAVAVSLADELSVTRGDLICRPQNQPLVTRDLDATVVWFTPESTLRRGRRLLVKQTTRTVRATVTDLAYRLDVNTLHRDEHATTLSLNEIGRVSLHTTEPLCVDDYQVNRRTGSVIFIDPQTNATVGAGMLRVLPGLTRSANVVHQPGVLSRDDRFAALGCRGATVLLTGLSGSGKSSIAGVVEASLVHRGQPAVVLDGDNLRTGLSGDLSFSPEDRTENLRRAGEVARLFAEAGVVVLLALISPAAADRDRMRALHDDAGLDFFEIFVNTPLAECEQRDTKGLYRRARTGEIPEFTGISAPYEIPERPDLELRPADGTVEELALRVLAALDERNEL